MRYLLLSLMLLGAAGSSRAAEDLVGFSKDMLEKDEAGLWMVVERQEQEIRTASIHVKDLELDRHVTKILCELVGESCSYLRPYVIRAPGFNAFMMPNGAFFIQTGLLLRVRNDGQLAAVIGHEASHYFRNHTIESIRKSRRTNNAFAVLGALVSAAGAMSANAANNPQAYSDRINMTNAAADMLQAAHIIAELQLLSYSRDMESESDADGVKWMSEAGYNPAEAAALWRDLIDEERAGGNEAGFSLVSTHPAPAKRISDIQQLIAGAGGASADDGAASKSRITTLVDNYRDDWIVDELRVLHPDQFKHLMSVQVAYGYPKAMAAYLEGLSYKQLADKMSDGKAKSTMYENAISAFNSAIELGGGRTKPEVYRDLGKVYEAAVGAERAKDAYQLYLEAAPNAWDAKFIQRKVDSL